MRHTGALFVSNPRRRWPQRKRKTVRRRKNLTKAAFVAKMDLNKWAVGKREIDKYRKRSDLDKLFTKYGGAAAKTKLRQIQRGHVSGFFDEKLGYGPENKKEDWKYTRPKGYGSRAYRKKVRARKGVAQPKPKQALKMYSGKAATSKKRTSKKGAGGRARRAGARSGWNVFVKEQQAKRRKDMKTRPHLKPYTMKQLSNMYGKAGRGTFVGPMQRPASGQKRGTSQRVMAAAASLRRSGMSQKAAMKKAWAMHKSNPRRRKNALAYKSNTRRRRKNALAYKRNGLAVRLNPSLGGQILAGGQAQGLFPTLMQGSTIELAAVTIGTMMASVGTHMFVSDTVLPAIGDALPVVTPVTDYLSGGPFGQTVQGVLAASVLWYGAGLPVVKDVSLSKTLGAGKLRDTAKAYCIALVTVPMVLDSIALYEMYFGGGMGGNGNGLINGNGLNNNVSGALAYGDGGAYVLAGLDVPTQEVLAEYQDAALGDAYYSGVDFGADEGAALIHGSHAWRRRFGRSPKRVSGARRWHSRHAGRRGHRWGWLIKLVGFDNARKIAALKPQKRIVVIKALKEQALANVQSLIAQHQNNAHVIEGPASALAVEGAANGATGAYGSGGYGALLYAGGTP